MDNVTNVVEQNGQWTACICTSPEGHFIEFRKRDGTTEVTLMRELVSNFVPSLLPVCEKLHELYGVVSSTGFRSEVFREAGKKAK